MKTILTFLLLFPVLAFAQTDNNNTKKWNIGAHFVYRSMNAYEFYDDYSYPRLSAEYSFTNYSSAEFTVERIGEIRLTDTTYPSFGRISLGYKLNVLPWFTKNEWLVNNLKVYNCLRYALNFRNDYTDFQLLYAPGLECYIYKNFGLNTEFVFGQSMKTTFAVGIKYRF